MKSVLLLKYTLTSPYFFRIKAMVYRKKTSYRKKVFFFFVDYVKVIKLHVVHT